MITKQVTYTITEGNRSASFQDAEGLTKAQIEQLAGFAITDTAYEAQATAQSSAVVGFQTLPAFVKTMTAEEAEAHINSQIFNGQTKAQLDASIDAAITDVTAATMAQINTQLAAIRTMLKAAVGALIGIRDLFIFTSKLLLYIRDLVIRFRQ